MIKEMIERKEVLSVHWVETSDMLADILTKRGRNYNWIQNVLTRNVIANPDTKRR